MIMSDLGCLPVLVMAHVPSAHRCVGIPFALVVGVGVVVVVVVVVLILGDIARSSSCGCRSSCSSSCGCSTRLILLKIECLLVSVMVHVPSAHRCVGTPFLVVIARVVVLVVVVVLDL